MNYAGVSGVGGSMSSTENIKQMIMSMFMVKSMTGGGGDQNSSGGFSMMYGLILFGLIEKLIEHGLPLLKNFANNYFNSKMKTITEKIKEKTTEITESKSTITFKANFLSGNQSLVSDAIIDHATNLPNVKKVLFTRNIYLLNNLEPICIDEQNKIYIKLNKKTELQGEGGEEQTQTITQVVDLYSYDLDISELRKYVNKIVTDYSIKIQNKLGDKLFYFDAIPQQAFQGADGKKDYSRMPGNLTFTMKNFMTNRKFINVVGKESKLIQKRVEFFKNNKKWYDLKGIPYTLGLLLCGPPGGGKTSTIKCVANETQRHIINIKLSNDITKTQLENLFFNDILHVVSNGKTESFNIPIEKRVYVFEDVDCQSSDVVIDRELKNKLGTNEKKEHIDPDKLKNEAIKTQPNKKADNPTLEHSNSDKLSLSCLLNIFDGILETPGRIIIMTSNYPDMLDKALIRPGRIDLICKFRKCDSNTIVEFIEKFYDVVLSEQEINIINNIPEELLTPAEITKIMFENFNDYKLAINDIDNISKIIREINIENEMKKNDNGSNSEINKKFAKELVEEEFEELLKNGNCISVPSSKNEETFEELHKKNYEKVKNFINLKESLTGENLKLYTNLKYPQDHKEYESFNERKHKDYHEEARKHSTYNVLPHDNIANNFSYIK